MKFLAYYSWTWRIRVDRYYHVLKDGVVFKDLGVVYYNQFNKEWKINSCLKKLKVLGWEESVSMVEQLT